MKPMTIWDEFWKVKDGVAAAVGTIVFGAMTANSLQGIPLFKDWTHSDLTDTIIWRICGGLFISALFALSFYQLYRHRQIFQSVRSLRQQKCTRGYSGLILLFSPSDKELRFIGGTGHFIEVNNTIKLDGNKLEEDIAQLHNTDNLRWNWQQTLRGLVPHIHSLKAVYVIGSEGKDTSPIEHIKRGSFKDLDRMKKIIEKYTTQGPEIAFYPSPVNYEDFSKLQDAIHCGLDWLDKSKGIDEEDVIIDVTGGFKTSSIAGAAVTLVRSVAFQYVQTDEPYDVWEYDLVVRSPITP